MSEKNPLWYELPADRWKEMNQSGWPCWVDSQKGKLYHAENGLKRLMGVHNSEYVKFGGIEEAQAYADTFLASAWVVQRFGTQKPITLTIVEGTTCDASFYRSRIRLAPFGMNEIVLLHELCHILHVNKAGLAHGRYFARSFLEAIGHRFGSAIKKGLRQLYVSYGVKCTAKPVYSVETKKRMHAWGLEMARRNSWGK